MLQEAKGRWRWIGPILLAVVGSLLAVPAVPVAARSGHADHPARYSACVGAATKSFGFDDTEGNFAAAAIDCLAHYRITKGTSATSYSPGEVIPRWQMALFLARATGPTGITLPPPVARGYTDIARLSPDARGAIHQLAQLGIMLGTSATTFDPYAPVTRVQMAVLLARFLDAAPTGPGGTDIEDVEPDDNVFRDLSGVPFSTYQAIRRLYELDVTEGTSASTFSPAAPVSRAQMAAFITRMLAHTNARPSGVSVQTPKEDVFANSDALLLVSVRDPNHQPFFEASVDIFTAADPTKAFDKDGRCTEKALAAAGALACVMDNSDPETDAAGNASVPVEVGDDDSVRIWAWRGEDGAAFDENTSEAATVDIEIRSDATALEVSDDLAPTARKLRFGDAVTFTFQLIDRDGDPVPKPGVSFSINVAESRDNGRTFDRSVITKETGVDGAAQVTFLHSDPTAQPGDVASLDLDVRIGNNLGVVDSTTIGMVDDDGTNDDPLLDWVDERAEPTSLVLTVPREYRVASSQDTGAGGAVRATLTDQFGGPVVREQISFRSSDPMGVPSGVRRATNSSGVATLHYLRDSAAGGVERITGQYERVVATVRQFWAGRVTGAATGSGEVRVVNTDNNTVIVVAGRDVLLVAYDANDHLYIGTETVRIDGFEEALSVGDTLAYEISSTAENAINTFTLTDS